MCINIGGGSNGSANKSAPPAVNFSTIQKPINSDALAGPLPSVLDPEKSINALSTRRRQLIDSFRYGLAGSFGQSTNLPYRINKNYAPLIGQKDTTLIAKNIAKPNNPNLTTMDPGQLLDYVSRMLKLPKETVNQSKQSKRQFF